jgi:CMP-N-acetylneuraminic acid synthetase
MKKIAIIPLKENSQRLENKNFLKIMGVPLWEITLNCLVECDKFDRIIINTDSEEVFSSGKKINSNVSLIDRPKYLNDLHAIEVVFHSLNSYDDIDEGDIIFMALPTSPFRKKESVIDALSMVEKTNNSVIGVTRANKLSCSYRKIENDFLVPISVSDFESKNLNIQSTDVEEYIVTGSIFASTYANLIKYKTFHQKNSIPIILNEFESIDVNSKFDYYYCKFLSNYENY